MSAQLLHTFYLPSGKRYQETWWHPYERVLVWQWWGLIPDELMHDAFYRVMQEAHARNPVGGVADHTHLEGGWKRESTDNLVRSFRAIAHLGLRLGVVEPPQTDVLTEMSMRMFLQRAPELDVRIFADFEDALRWAAGTQPSQEASA